MKLMGIWGKKHWPFKLIVGCGNRNEGGSILGFLLSDKTYKTWLEIICYDDFGTLKRSYKMQCGKSERQI